LIQYLFSVPVLSYSDDEHTTTTNEGRIKQKLPAFSSIIMRSIFLSHSTSRKL